jgi:membrane protein
MSTHPLFEANKDLLIMYVLDFVNPTHSQALTQNIQNFLVNASDLGTFGVIYLLVIFTMFFQDFEHIINKIFHTKKRNLIATFLLYLSFIIIIPFFLAIFTYISTMLPNSSYKTILSFLFGLSFITLIFILSVNTKVSIKAALISAFITVNVLKLTQFVFSYYVLYNEAIGTIYGAFSVVFFMFLWLYLSWIIYLYGVKICFIINKRVLEK